MKRFACALMALMMMGAMAVAEDASGTMDTTIFVEGEAEQITLTRYESALGYAIWYDADRFAVEHAGETADVFLPVGSVEGVRMEVRALDDESIETYTRTLMPEMEEGGYEVSRMEAWDIDTPYPMAQLQGVKDGHIRMCFLMETGEGVYAFRMEYPAEAAEGFGARLIAMLNTFKIENG